MEVRTYSLEDAARIICGVDDNGQVVRGGVRWLAKHLTGELQPQLPSYVVARRRRMTQAHIDESIALLEPEVVAVPEVPSLGGMTKTSRRRLAS